MAASSHPQSVYCRLHDYAFLEDRQFMAGWAEVCSRDPGADQGALALKFMEAKVFYFSRLVETADLSLDEYLAWLNEKKDISTDPATLSESEATPLREFTNNLGESSSAQDANAATRAVSNSTDEEAGTAGAGELQQAKPAAGEGTSLPVYPPSFYNILEKVQEGQPIPGVEQLDVRPTNTAPTASCIQRVPKPWERVGAVVEDIGNGEPAVLSIS